MTSGPTSGAKEEDPRSWQASPVVSLAIRGLAFALPLVVSILVLRGLSGYLYRPEHTGGLILWILQAGVIGALVSAGVDRYTRRLLPLAALFGMSLAFPDQAPSRFSVALRAGTVSRLRARAGEVRPVSPSMDANEAAAHALALVAQLGRHDRLTRGHTERVRAYSDMIGEEMGLSQHDRIRLSWAALLHDVGKLTVPASILNSDGRPTDSEWATLRNHPAAGRELLGSLADWLGEWVLAASEHHERWDGKGYPLGIEGTGISLAGRIVAVADAYDVITSKRSYKNAMSPQAARRELLECSGSQFDPQVVRAFLNCSLGRRWIAGPFAWLANLPLGAGGAVARVPSIAAAAAVAVTATTVPLVQQIPETTLAFESTPTSNVEGSTSEPTVISAPSNENPGLFPPISVPLDPTTTLVPTGSTPSASTVPETSDLTSTTIPGLPPGGPGGLLTTLPTTLTVPPTVELPVTVPTTLSVVITTPTVPIPTTIVTTIPTILLTTTTTQATTTTTQATTTTTQATTTTTECPNFIIVLGVKICL